MKRIKIFISSPSDVEHERKICKKVLRQLNDMLMSHFDVYLDPYFWETASSAVGMGNPQSRIPSPKNFDLYIGILWKRFGTPTGEIDPESGRLNKSGTIQEFTEAYEAWKQTKYTKPEIKFLHKKTEETKELLADEQYQQVQTFLKGFDVDGEHPGIYHTFSNDEEFESAIQQYVMDYVMNSNNTSYLPNHYQASGVTNLFLHSDNDARNRSKNEALENANHIRLIAHSGNSFLNNISQRFFQKIEDCLDRDGIVEIILANPYSQMGYYITLGDTNRRDKKLVDFLKEACVEDAVNRINNSPWVSFKLKPAIDGFLFLRDIYGDRIQLKFCSYEMNSTILLTEDVAYHEPYMHCVGSEHGMNAFEIRVQKNSSTRNNFFNALSEYFNFLWEISEDYDSYITNEDHYKQTLLDKITEMHKN